MLRIRGILLRFRTSPGVNVLKTISKPTQLLLGSYLYFHHSTISLNDMPQHIAEVLGVPDAAKHPPSFLRRLYQKCKTLLRFLHLAMIFIPVALLLPLRLFEVTDHLWCWLFANAI